VVTIYDGNNESKYQGMGSFNVWFIALNL